MMVRTNGYQSQFQPDIFLDLFILPLPHWKPFKQVYAWRNQKGLQMDQYECLYCESVSMDSSNPEENVTWTSFKVSYSSLFNKTMCLLCCIYAFSILQMASSRTLKVHWTNIRVHENKWDSFFAELWATRAFEELHSPPSWMKLITAHSPDSNFETCAETTKRGPGTSLCNLSSMKNHQNRIMSA